MITIKETYINDELLPRVWEAEDNSTTIDEVCQWLKSKKKKIDDIIDMDGALLLRGLNGIQSAEDFEKALSSISPSLMDYIGGTSPRKVISGKVVTATELPSDYSIPLHQEMSYTDSPPDRIAFFCLKPADQDGFTTIADMRKLTSSISKDVCQRFEEGGVQLRRTLPADDAIDKKPGIAKPWSEVFNTTDREEVNKLVSEKGWKTHWLADGSVQLWQEIRPAKKNHEKTHDNVWFNQAHIFAQATTLHWAKKDKREKQLSRLQQAITSNPDMMDQVFHKDGKPIADDDVLHLFEVMQNHEIPIALEPSDILLLNNTLISHGRTSYVGERSLLAALIS